MTMTKAGTEKKDLKPKQPDNPQPDNWKAYVSSVKPMFYKHSSPDPEDPIPSIRPVRKRMGVPRVKEFAFGISTKTGATLVGLFSLIGGIMISAPAMVWGQSFIDYLRNATAQTETIMTFDEDYDPGLVAAVKQIHYEPAIATTIINFCIGYGLYEVFVSVLLLLGIKKEKRWCMVPWLITDGIGCFFSLLALAIVLILPGLVPEYYTKFPLVGTYVYFSQLSSVFFTSVVSLYVFCVVYSHYRDIKSPQLGFTAFETF